MTARATSCLAILLATITLAACQPEGDSAYMTVWQERDAALTEARTLRETVAKLEAQRNETAKQIATLQRLAGLGDKRISLLFPVTSVEISRYTGPISTDKTPGPDALKIIFTPRDAAGHPIKAAGEIRLQLFDLGEAKGDPSGPCFDEVVIPATQASKHWSGGMLTNHYTFTRPLPKKQAHSNLTLRVSFTDYLTGKTHTDQKMIPLRPKTP